MKKILFVANVTKEHILKFHVPTIKKFKEEGWQVDVISAGEDNVPFCDNQINAKWQRSPFSFKTIIGIKQLRQILDENYYDVVYCHTPVGGFVGRISGSKARKRGTKVVYFAHGFHFCKEASLLNWVFYPIEKHLAKKTDALFVINDDDYDITKKKFNHEMALCKFPGIGVNFSRLIIANKKAVREKYRNELKIGENDIVLIYVAELLKNKNQGYLLNVLKQLSDGVNTYRLILVGPDHSNGLFVKMSKKLGLEDKVIFTGWRNDIGELMVASDIYVASSIREGFGINLIEAMYCGLPVVAVNNRGHRAVIKNGENGFLVSLKDSTEMVDCISKIVKDDSLRKRISNIDVSNYDCRIVAEKIYEKISSL